MAVKRSSDRKRGVEKRWEPQSDAPLNGFIVIDWHVIKNFAYVYALLKWGKGKFCRRLGAVDPAHPTGLLDCVLAGYHRCQDVDELRRLLAADKSQREMFNGRSA